MPLTVTTEEKTKGQVAVRPVGSIDANTHAVLGAEVDALLKKSPSLVIFDMSGVTYVSSAGISVVLRTEKALKGRGGKTLLVNLKPEIKKVFDIVKALPSEQVFGSVKELDAYLTVMQKKVKGGEIGQGARVPGIGRSFVIRNDLAELEALAAGVLGFWRGNGVGEEVLHDLRLVLEEAVSNTIRHGYEDAAPRAREIHVRTGLDNGAIVLVVEDDAKAFNPLEAPALDLTLPLEERPLGGMGITLIRALTDRVEYKRTGGKNVLRLTKRFAKS